MAEYLFGASVILHLLSLQRHGEAFRTPSVRLLLFRDFLAITGNDRQDILVLREARGQDLRPLVGPSDFFVVQQPK